MPRAGRFASDNEAKQFEREARSAAHSAIRVSLLLEVGRFEGVPFLVTDFIRGLTLSEYLEAHRPGHRDSAMLVAEVAEALGYAHSMGVVHRDVKPSNIMLERAGPGSGSGSGPRPDASPAGPMGRPPVDGPRPGHGRDVALGHDDAGGRDPGHSGLHESGAGGRPGRTRSARAAISTAWGSILYELLTGRVAVPGEAAHASSTRC